MRYSVATFKAFNKLLPKSGSNSCIHTALLEHLGKHEVGSDSYVLVSKPNQDSGMGIRTDIYIGGTSIYPLWSADFLTRVLRQFKGAKE